MRTGFVSIAIVAHMSTHILSAQKLVSCIQIKRRLRKTNPPYRDQVDKRFARQSVIFMAKEKTSYLFNLFTKFGLTS